MMVTHTSAQHKSLAVSLNAGRLLTEPAQICAGFALRGFMRKPTLDCLEGKA